MKNIFGERLQELRKDKNITQQQMAEKLNTTRATYSRWETGIHQPDLETISKIADILDTSVGYLIGEIKVSHKDVESLPRLEQDDITGQYFFRFDTKELNEQEKEEFEEQLEDMASFLVNSIKKRRDKK